MTKIIVTPEKSSILLNVPNEYVGKKLEVLMYAVEELSENSYKQKTMSSFKGILAPEEADQLQQSVKQSREEWDRNF